MTLADLIKKFDKLNKGYLVYDQFKAMVKSLGTRLTNADIQDCINTIDLDGDGFLEYAELNEALSNTGKMGVPGSPWKMYVHPVEDVMCYHNFDTGELIFDYMMKDWKLKEIAIANMFGESEAQAVMMIRGKKDEDWELTVNNYMVSRIQYMYRMRRARKWRAKKLFKIEKRFHKIRMDQKKFCVRVIETTYTGRKARAVFKRQLLLSYEKIWDTHASKLFWYNHTSRVSVWERPRILERYEDVITPGPWIPIDIAQEFENSSLHGSDSGTVSDDRALILAKPRRERAQHYWHVVAKRDLPRKPDGLKLCCSPLTPEEYGDGIESDDWCRNIAVHWCVDCAADYCASCLRRTHEHPLGFGQKTKASKEQYLGEMESIHVYMYRIFPFASCV